MRSFDTMSEARKEARRINGTYRKVCGGWLVMDWAEYLVWRKQI